MAWNCYDLWGGVFDIKKLKHEWIVIFVVLIAGAILRYLYLITPGLDSDQAVVGLMAKHILNGESPVFYYGQPYLGSLEAFWVALNFKLFGVSTFILDMSIAELSILYFLVVYVFAKNVFNRWIGLMSLIYVVAAPFYLEYHYVLARGAYIELLILGTLFLWLLYVLFYEDKWKSRPFLYSIIVGFLAGVMWWLHPMSVYYILTAVVVVLLSGRAFLFSKYVWLSAGSFILGSLPFWVWHYERHFHMLNFLFQGGAPHYLKSFLNMWTFEIPILLGLYKWLTPASQIPVLSKILFGIFLFSIFWMTVKSIVLRNNNSTKRENGRLIVIIFMVVVTLVYMCSGWGTDKFPRHLIPVFSVVPIFIACFIYDISKFSRPLAGAVFLLFVFSGLYSAYPDMFPVARRVSNYKAMSVCEKKLFNFLLGKGIRGVYSPNYWLGMKLTFKSDEKVIFATLWGRYPKYVKMVDSMRESAYVFRGKYWYENFAKLLKKIGMPTSRRAYVAGWTVYYSFKPFECSFYPLDRSTWRAEATGNYPSAFAFDTDIYGRWKIVSPVARGSYFLIDMGKKENIGMIRFVFPVDFRGDFPYRMSILSSADGQHWDVITNRMVPYYSMEGKHLYYKPYGFADVVFPERKVRFLKFVYLAGNKRLDWSIPEVFVYRRLLKKENYDFVTARKKVISYLVGEDVKLLFGDYFTASFAALHTKMVSLCYGNNILYSPKEGGFYVEHETFRWMPMAGKTAFLTTRQNATIMEKLFRRWGIAYRVVEFFPYVVFTTEAFGSTSTSKFVGIKHLRVAVKGKQCMISLSNPASVGVLTVHGKKPIGLLSGYASFDGNYWEKLSFIPTKLYWINGLLFTAFGNADKSYVVLQHKRYKFWKLVSSREFPKGVSISVEGVAGYE